ncbi:MAG: hypothetical protein KatS3mg087_1186 [Patescibacteria group bacterium]|nr:MAG: hypothetical protein KatS3mg087_1186 [Patescibacteria group bacterium]
MALDFSGVVLTEIPVIGPDGNKYVLKEATAKAAKEFNNARISGVVLGPTGKPQKLESIGELESLLVSLCLFAEDGRPVHRQQIEKWPARVVRKLFIEAKRISKLDEDVENLTVSLKELLTELGVSIDSAKQIVMKMYEQDQEKHEALYRILIEGVDENPM